MTPEEQREQEICFAQANLEDWLRSAGGKPWFEGIVMECVALFPPLDRFQVSAVIYKLRDEDTARWEARWEKEQRRKLEEMGFGDLGDGNDA